jgi:pimeloyl-ACP methyl ester carboxylesterase
VPQMPGRLVEVEGRGMHIDCAGDTSSRSTVIIEGGMSGISPFYTRLKDGLQKSTRVCTYDRAGLGWSDPANSPRNAMHLAVDLHALLRAAEVPPPYVLAGHSLGGLLALSFQQTFPTEVTGIVLLDASYPGQTWNEKAMLKTYRRAKIGAAVGITRIYNPARTWFSDLPENERRAILYFSNQSSIYSATMGEIRGLNSLGVKTKEIRSLGSLPLLVITAGNICDPRIESEERKSRCAAWANNWIQQHRNVARLSSKGRQVTLSNATHTTLITNDEFANEVVDLIEKEVLSQSAQEFSFESSPR